MVALAIALGVAPLLYSRVTQTLAAQEHLYRGVDLLNSGNAGSAEEEWRAAIRMAPGNGNPYRALGSLYLAQGRLAEAREVLRKLTQVAPKEPHVLCELAEVEYRQGTVPLLRATAEDASLEATREPDCIRAQIVAGNAWLDQGDVKRGLEHLRRAVRLNPSDVALTLQLIRFLLEGQQLEEATRTAAELTRRYPGYAQGYTLLATCYQLYPPGSPQARDLQPTLERALLLDPTNGLAQAQLGHVLLAAGDTQKAVRHLEVARLLNSRRTSTFFDLGLAYARLGRTAEAEKARAEFRRRSTLENDLAALEKRLALEPGSTKDLERLKALATALGEPERARRFLRQAPAPAPPGSQPEARP